MACATRAATARTPVRGMHTGPAPSEWASPQSLSCTHAFLGKKRSNSCSESTGKAGEGVGGRLGQSRRSEARRVGWHRTGSFFGCFGFSELELVLGPKLEHDTNLCQAFGYFAHGNYFLVMYLRRYRERERGFWLPTRTNFNRRVTGWLSLRAPPEGHALTRSTSSRSPSSSR